MQNISDLLSQLSASLYGQRLLRTSVLGQYGQRILPVRRLYYARAAFQKDHLQAAQPVAF